MFRTLAVLLTSLLTVVCQNSAAEDAVRSAGVCIADVEGLQSFDKTSWLKYTNLATHSNSSSELSAYAHLIKSMPDDLKNILLHDLAAHRMKRIGNKKNIDIMFNLLDRGDVLINSRDSDPEAAYKHYFIHEAGFFAPAYDASLALSIVRIIHSILPPGSSIAAGGSFFSARANINRVNWDMDLIGTKIDGPILSKVSSAIEKEFKARGLRPPKIHFLDSGMYPKVYLDDCNIAYFDIYGEGAIILSVAPPPLPVPSTHGFNSWEYLGKVRQLPFKQNQ